MASSVDAYGNNDPIRTTWRATRISTLTTTVVKAAPGKVHALVVGVPGASSTRLTIYDNASAASGTVIGVFDTVNVTGTILIDAECLNGITVLTATGTAADATVMWV